MTSVSSLKRPYSTDSHRTAIPDLSPWGSTCASRNDLKSPARFIQRGLPPALFATNIPEDQRPASSVCPRKTGLLSARQPEIPKDYDAMAHLEKLHLDDVHVCHGRSRKPIQRDPSSYLSRNKWLVHPLALLIYCLSETWARPPTQCAVNTKCKQECSLQTARVGCRRLLPVAHCQ